MGCLKLNNNEYKRIKNQMKLFGNADKQSSNNQEIQEMITQSVREVIGEQNVQPEKKSFSEKYGVTIISCLFTAVFTAVLSILGNYLFLKVDIEGLKSKVDSIEKNVNNLVTDSSKMWNDLYLDSGVMDQLGNINEALDLKVIIVTDEETASILNDLSIEPNDISNTSTAILKDTPIGTDADGNVYVAEDLLGQVILLTYEDEGKDVFFLGRYNENYHWDGYCVTNTYNFDGTLFGICESNFDDGKRLDYKTLLCVDDANNEWDYYSRICNEDSNAGVSVEYYLEYEKAKNFTNTNVRYTDVMYVDEFIAEQDVEITQYYYGNTANGYYNDKTGDAYLITFDKRGLVETLYVGNFVNGYPSDNTKNAWSIVYSDNFGYYVHNTGVFINGHAVDGSYEEITQEQIDELVSKYQFGCELRWKVVK